MHPSLAASIWVSLSTDSGVHAAIIWSSGAGLKSIRWNDESFESQDEFFSALLTCGLNWHMHELGQNNWLFYDYMVVDILRHVHLLWVSREGTHLKMR